MFVTLWTYFRAGALPLLHLRTRAAALAAILMMTADRAYAQAGPSGTLTVQMRVGDAVTNGEQARPSNARGRATLAAGKGGDPVPPTPGGSSCNVNVNNGSYADFGALMTGPDNTLPQLVRSAGVFMICSGSEFPPGSITPVEIALFHGASAAISPRYMTLDGLPASQGIEYQLCADDADSACQTPFLGHKAIAELVAVGPNPFATRASVVFYAKLLGPYPRNMRPTSGTYSDTLTVYISY
jgi:spore coat protein U-like protein